MYTKDTKEILFEKFLRNSKRQGKGRELKKISPINKDRNT
jgi:hypothetical protein